MEYSFPRYLVAKQTVDDRALNRHVLDVLQASLPLRPVRIIEAGAGMGNMLARLLAWEVIDCAEYIHIDAMQENIEFAMDWLPRWATEAGMCVELMGERQFRLYDEEREVRVTLEQADVLEYAARCPQPGDLLVAHAFLDLMPMPESLPTLLSLTNRLAWLTVNFDGVTTFEPVIDATLDAKIEQLYHQTMDRRRTGGDSRSGRHLFGHLRAAGADILAAGPSDWVVYPRDGKYPAEEAHFLQYILNFFEESLTGHPELDAADFANWLQQRRRQIERGELVYIAHQMDFLARTHP